MHGSTSIPIFLQTEKQLENPNIMLWMDDDLCALDFNPGWTFRGHYIILYYKTNQGTIGDFFSDFP